MTLVRAKYVDNCHSIRLYRTTCSPVPGAQAQLHVAVEQPDNQPKRHDHGSDRAVQTQKETVLEPLRAADAK